MSVEPRRGCGFRKVGGLYLVAPDGGRPCCRLPVPLTVCETCGHGIKPTRGFTWIDPGKLLGALRTDERPLDIGHVYAPDGCFFCPLADPAERMGRRAGLLWIGEKFYATPRDFNDEAAELGISRRISRLPRGFKIGETWVLLAHRSAIPKQRDVEDRERDARKPAGAGVFRVFRPTAVEMIVTDETPQAELDKLRERGITPVIVPADDEDHQ